MRVKLDENLPESLLQVLIGLGHDVDNIRLEGLVGKPDPLVWDAAQRSERFLITQDLDFSDLRKFSPAAFREKPPESWTRCFVVLTDHKLRVHKPPP